MRGFASKRNLTGSLSITLAKPTIGKRPGDLNCREKYCATWNYTSLSPNHNSTTLGKPTIEFNFSALLVLYSSLESGVQSISM